MYYFIIITSIMMARDDLDETNRHCLSVDITVYRERVCMYVFIDNRKCSECLCLYFQIFLTILGQ
jgi:hypothetical protein